MRTKTLLALAALAALSVPALAQAQASMSCAA
jgi:hypothetical protein